jgi:hypothetical protein
VKPVVVVGSGASGVHFALSLLERGREVVMLDVGHENAPAPLPEEHFTGLKQRLPDPVSYLLGEDFEGVTYPDSAGEYYGLPPSKSFVFRRANGFTAKAKDFAPLFSFARGGLGEAWTAGVYPFNEVETRSFPFAHTDLLAGYDVVAGRIGISGGQDDLTRFMPLHDHLLEPLTLDRHSAALLKRYQSVRRGLNEELGCYMGGTRVATLTRALDGREACTYLGRCLWGCPRAAFYTPALTLAECLRYPGFRYIPGMYVSHFRIDRGRRVASVVVRAADGSGSQEMAVSTLALAAGTLSSARIFLESIYHATGEILRLGGLMDNQQVLVPFVNLDMVGKPCDPASYQYHQLGIGLDEPRPAEYVHCQVTTLKTGMAHPILQSLPFDTRTALTFFRQLRTALGVINVNFHDTRRDASFVTLDRRYGGDPGLVVEYVPDAGEAAHVKQALGRLRKAMHQLHCFVPPGLTHVRPKGASVHYAGTFPSQTSGHSLSTTPECRSTDFENLFFVDGSTFPFLPAKNITFSLMANAVRVAAAAF